MMISKFTDKYDFLSNFFEHSITWEGITYPSVEHAYQAAKSKDVAEKTKIALLSTPGQAKRVGRAVQLRPDWEHVKIGIMLELVRLKFSDPILKKKLLDTGDEELVEGNFWHDFFWGVCDGTGLNWLGKILMEVRGELAN
jgi:hypothetical protein